VGAGHFGHKTLRHQDTLGHFGTTKLVLKFKTNHRWSCVSSELSSVEVSRLFFDHGTRVEVSRTTFLVSKCLEIGAEVSRSVLMPKPKCLVAEMSGNRSCTGAWLLLSELFPAYIKGRAIAVTTCFNWAANLIVSITFLDFISKFT